MKGKTGASVIDAPPDNPSLRLNEMTVGGLCAIYFPSAQQDWVRYGRLFVAAFRPPLGPILIARKPHIRADQFWINDWWIYISKTACLEVNHPLLSSDQLNYRNARDLESGLKAKIWRQIIIKKHRYPPTVNEENKTRQLKTEKFFWVPKLENNCYCTQNLYYHFFFFKKKISFFLLRSFDETTRSTERAQALQLKFPNKVDVFFEDFSPQLQE